jgi:hypothetical protein
MPQRKAPSAAIRELPLPFNKPWVSNGIRILLTQGVHWSTFFLYVQTVVETPSYLAVASKLFSEAEREDIVTTVAANPECGAVMAGTGGFRKVRVAREGMGKSGGARIVYIWRNDKFPVFLITVFPKTTKKTLRRPSAML